ncbi:hypothetical protein ACF0H5_016786 [Mactra antiquata]
MSGEFDPSQDLFASQSEGETLQSDSEENNSVFTLGQDLAASQSQTLQSDSEENNNIFTLGQDLAASQSQTLQFDSEESNNVFTLGQDLAASQSQTLQFDSEESNNLFTLGQDLDASQSQTLQSDSKESNSVFTPGQDLFASQQSDVIIISDSDETQPPTPQQSPVFRSKKLKRHHLVSVECQTEVSTVNSVYDKLFNREYRKALVKCQSFFMCNTLADDNSPIFIDMYTQTIESGGLIVDKGVQTHSENLEFETVFTENVLSHTEVQCSSFENSDESDSYSQEDVMLCNSSANTIIAFC